MCEWINPKEKQPNDFQIVIAFSLSHGVCPAQYQTQCGFDDEDEESRPIWVVQEYYHDVVPFDDVTAWMPLPKAPN